MAAYNGLKGSQIFDAQDCRPYALYDHESLPSLTHSDHTLDESPAIMNSHYQEDINDVLDDVIVKINRITDHLRVVGENEAANHFTREMTGTFRGLYNIIAPWDIEKCLMNVPQNLSSTEPSGASKRLMPAPPGDTWASVAAIEPLTDKNNIIKFRPSDAVKRTTEEAELQEHQHDARDRRVVWIRPWNESRPLRDISKEMSELGAIYSIAFAPEEQAVCIIFQHAWCAIEFLHHCAEHVGRMGISPFGSEQHVSPGLPYPINDGLRRMDNPHNERRRLTFARSQLFSNGVSESRFRKDIEEVVGRMNIELLWLFNTGNATVVFSAVPLARMVKDKFLQYSKIKHNPYEGIMISYSHDPCERNMHLVSQIPGHANFVGSNGSSKDMTASRPYRSNTLSTDMSKQSSRRMSAASSDYFAPPKRRSPMSKAQFDNDGWQTVKKRR